MTIYTHISKGRNSVKNGSIDLIFFSTGSEDSNEVFLFFESYHYLKIMKRKCQKTEFHGDHLGFLAAILNFLGGSRVFLKHATMEVHAKFGACIIK